MEKPPHRLSVIGYWSYPRAPAEESRGWPDPGDLRGKWDATDRRETIAYLKRGKSFRSFMGRSSCRICGEPLGSGELTDGEWAWPEGLDHYVAAHDVRLPRAFVAKCRSHDPLPDWVTSLEPEMWLEGGPESMVPLRASEDPAWVLDDADWLDWSAANTPARPAADAASLDEVRLVCNRLSHATWKAEVDEVMGRWRVRISDDGGSTRLYVRRCSAGAFERRLLSLRWPDSDAILDGHRANAIAAEYDGSWGALRVLAGHPQAWYIWVKPADGDWPTSEQVNQQIAEMRSMRQGFGWVTAHPGGGTSFLAPPADETGWRWLISRRRAEAEGRCGDG